MARVDMSAVEQLYPQILFLTLVGIFVATWLLTASGLTVSQGQKDNETKFSLSKLQFGLWTIVLAGGWLVVSLRVFLTRGLDLSQCPVRLPLTVLVLMGISVGSTGFAKFLGTEAAKRLGRTSRTAPVPLRDRLSLQSWLTYIQDPDGAMSMPRAQMALWTVVVIIGYVLALAEVVDSVNASTTAYTLPEVDATLLTLMGVSHVSYVLMAHEKPGDAKSAPTPPAPAPPPAPPAGTREP